MKRLWLSLVLLAFLALAGSGWYGWYWATTPVPPNLALPPDDPELSEAMSEALQVVHRAPRSAKGWGELGMLLRAVGHREEAAACFEQAARLEPQSARWVYLQGESLSQPRPDRAAEYLRRAAARDDLLSMVRLAKVLLTLDRAEEAQRWLDRAGPRAQGADLDGVVALLSGQAALSREDLASAEPALEAASTSPYARKRATVLLMQVYLRSGRAARAQRLEASIRTMPEDQPWPDEYLVECMRRGRGRVQALRHVEHLEKQGKWAEAVTLLRELEARRPDYNVLLGLGRNLARLGDLAAAETPLRQAIQREPERAIAYSFLGQVLVLRKDWSQAEAEARKALERHDRDAMAYVVLGRALLEQGKPEPASTATRDALAISPDMAEAHLLHGEVLLALGKKAEARRHFQLAAQLARPGDDRAARALKRLEGG